MGEDEGSVSGTSRMNSKGSSTPPTACHFETYAHPLRNESIVPARRAGGGGRRCMRVQTRATHIRMYKSGRGGGGHGSPWDENFVRERGADATAGILPSACE